MVVYILKAKEVGKYSNNLVVTWAVMASINFKGQGLNAVQL